MRDKIKLSDFDAGKRAALIFGLFVFAVYALFPTKTFYWDGIIYAKFIEDSPNFGAHLFHPNHLVYNFLGYFAHRAAQLFGLEARALFVLQFLTVIFGALSAYVFFLIGKRAFRSNYLSLSTAAIFAFSAAWWKFSTDADVYVISVFFLLAAFLLLLPDRRPRPLAVACAHTLAMFFHQLAVLFFPVAVLGLVFQIRGLERRQTAIVLRYALTAFALTFGTYCLGFYLQTGSLDVKYFAKWMTSYAASAGFSFDFFESLRQTFRGHQKLFLDGSSNLFERSFFSYVLLFVFAGAAVLFFVRLIGHRKEIRLFFKSLFGGKSGVRPVVWLAAAWIFSYSIFLFVFMPENLFYRLFYFPALVVLLGALLAPFEQSRTVRRWRLALFVLLFCLYNFLFYIQPNANIRDHTQIWLALRAKEVWTGKTIVFYNPSISDDPHEANNRLVRYFNPSVEWRSLDSLTLAELETETAKIGGAGGDVWLEALLFKHLSGDARAAAWLAENSDPRSELAVPRYDMRFVRIAPPARESLPR